MKFAVTVLILVFVVFAVFAFLFAVDPRYTLPLPGMDRPQQQQQQEQTIHSNDIQTLLLRLDNLDADITALEERKRSFDLDLQLLKDQRTEVVEEINDWMDGIRDQVGPNQNASHKSQGTKTSTVENPVVQSGHVLVPQLG